VALEVLKGAHLEEALVKFPPLDLNNKLIHHLLDLQLRVLSVLHIFDNLLVSVNLVDEEAFEAV